MSCAVVDASLQPGGLPRAGLLTASEEQHLARAAGQGEAWARNRLFESNVRLVHSIARRYRSTILSSEDLVQEGKIGLLVAIEKFDPERGIRFSTYATYWIRQAIARSIENHGRIIRLPANLIDDARSVDGARLRLTRQLGRPPTVAELCQETGLHESRVNSIEDLVLDPISLQTPSGEEDGSLLLEILPDDRAQDPESETLTRLESAAIQSLLLLLRPQERRIIEQRYGLVDGQMRTLQEVSQALRLSREAIRQTENRALRKLREFARRMDLCSV